MLDKTYRLTRHTDIETQRHTDTHRKTARETRVTNIPTSVPDILTNQLEC
jgi:hypothetical protein